MPARSTTNARSRRSSAVLRGGVTALRIGWNVRGEEAACRRAVRQRRGVMCNSGSSALYLAVEVLDLEPGDEIITSAVTFSTDIAPMVRKRDRARVRRRHHRHVPDRRGRDRGNDRPAHQGDPRTEPDRQRTRLGPHPRDRRPARPQGGRRLVRRAGPHAARHADRRAGGHQPDQLRALAHHHRRRHRRHGVLRRRRLADKALLLRRWGRRSEVQLFGSRKGVEHASSAPSTATSSTTTSSSSTKSVGTSSRPNYRPRSASCNSTSSPTTSRAGNATSS